jgi:hypothetical protein
LIGQYVGQTGPKTIKQLERGLGKVLFVDEAYRLSEGYFAQEAVNELVDMMTKPKFAGKMVIILAGYDNDMNNLLRVNEGLSSRFADEIIFPSLSPKQCLQLLEHSLKQSHITIPTLQDPSTHGEFLNPITELSKLPSWGNARDVQTLAKSMVRIVFQTSTAKVGQLTLSKENAMTCIQAMLTDRRARGTTPAKPPADFTSMVQMKDAPPQPPPSFSTSTANHTISEAAKEEEEEPLTPAGTTDAIDPTRDAGVSDDIWAQLQKDQQIAELQAQTWEARIRAEEEACRIAEAMEKKLAEEAAALRALQAKTEAEALELLRRREEARIREVEANAEKERKRRALEESRRRELERKRVEEMAQVKLKEMGVCPVGYQWIKQGHGYRCAGGSHFVSDAELRM